MGSQAADRWRVDGDGGRFQGKAACHQPHGCVFLFRVQKVMPMPRTAKQKRAELKSVLDPQTKKRVGELVSAVGITIPHCYRRDLDPNREEASARRDCYEDQAF